ncbi:MAG: hypothetical protein RMK29_04435 [Myxococcales bacterium]|nr:hypothetical protein [Myxococcota bacterium]MDW8280936.1 hypothetical protein [Myxococcales bacterium]
MAYLSIRTLLLCALALEGACALSPQGRQEAASAQARQTPHFSDCIHGKKLEAASNCAELCASLGKACQNFGCPHPAKPDDRYGGLSYGLSLCSDKPLRSFQCYDPFDNEVGVRCCCVSQ